MKEDEAGRLCRTHVSLGNSCRTEPKKLEFSEIQTSVGEL